MQRTSKRRKRLMPGLLAIALAAFSVRCTYAQTGGSGGRTAPSDAPGGTPPATTPPGTSNTSAPASAPVSGSSNSGAMPQAPSPALAAPGESVTPTQVSPAHFTPSAPGVLPLSSGPPLQGAPASGGVGDAQAVSLADAIRMAQKYEPTFAAAVAAKKTADIDRSIARTSLLPSVVYHNQMLVTQSNGAYNAGGQVGVQSSPIFIANNAIHEYASQAQINETIGFKRYADAQVASAAAARAAAELEVSRRGLISTVVTLYFSAMTSQRKLALLGEAAREAQDFVDLTQKREEAREVAHADVLKAQLQQQQRQRDLLDARVAADKARLELGVLLFPDPMTQYSTQVGSTDIAIPSRAEVAQLAGQHNPELRSALADVASARASVTAARAAYLPDLSLNFDYGIDAPQFAKRGPQNVRNLGYSVGGTLDIPVWDWLATQKRVRQNVIKADLANSQLTLAKRKLVATLEETYAEASAAQQQLSLLDLSERTAVESLRLTKLRYSAGESTALEVVDAQSSYLTAATAHADGIVRYQSALAALQVLMGTL